jgi:prepilin-type N-terminal cleavage/methylation domain-containing protein
MRGVTLLELIVALALLAVILGVSGLALASLRTPREAQVVRALREARTKAIRGGTVVRFSIDRPPNRLTALFLPDGRAVGDSVDPLTGVFRAGR